MRIALDGREFSEPHGIGRVLRHLLGYLAEHAGTDTFLLLTRSDATKLPPSITSIPLSRFDWWNLSSWLQKNHIDCFYSPYYKLPHGFTGRQINTVHDLGFLTYPLAGYTRGRVYRFFARRRLSRALVAANSIIAVSNFTKNELLQYTNIAANKITVIPSGYDDSIFFTKSTDGTVASKYGINKPYLLYVGNCTPHKRVELLLKAWQEESKFSLVIVGRLDRWAKELQQRYLRTGLIWTGPVPDHELAELYRNASVFVYPSHYEGFGIPPIEALACRTPVVATRSGALPETLKDSAFWVEATPSGLRQGWQQLINDTALTDSLLNRAEKIIARYKRDVVAAQIHRVLTDV